MNNRKITIQFLIMERKMITSFLLLLVGLMSCSSDDTPSDPVAQNGNLSLAVTINEDVEEKTSFRQQNEGSGIKINIVDAEGKTVVSYASIEAVPEEIELPAGVYKAKGESNSTAQFGFEDPQYGGSSEDFSIQSEKLTTSSLECKLQNAKVTVGYSDVVKNQFGTYSSVVKSSLGQLAFSQTETRAGYFRASGNLTVTATIGEGDSQLTSEITLTSIQPTTHYAVTVDVEQGSGKLVISVDETILAGGDKGIVITPIEGETRPSYNTSIGFFTKDGKLYDANGMEFIARGVNNGHFWFDSGNRNTAIKGLTPIAAYHSNTVRMVWQTNYVPSQWNNVAETTQLRKMINTAIDKGMVPMIELHDVTGDESKENLLKMAEYFVRPDILGVMKEYESILMINIANEWSGKTTTYRDAYKEAVTMMREAGLKHTIVIDGSGWGQDMTTIFDYGQEIIDNDPQKNILFSVHMYQSYRNETTITSNLEKAVEMKLPLIVGEFGFQHGGTPENPIQIPYKHILAECERLGIGWYAWSWKGNSGGVEYLDLSVDWEGTELTDWGKGIVNDVNGLENTAKKVSVIK
ncbi:DUF4493 domain-containing protein [Flammeovirga aprica]|uniref:DUF4493 domain-containing protein n=1 Tax=Flammeovirga aprica JL-4 TaxID=694437 RepID=A0A7X9XBZ1_9BACT|nr:DUF4493 domain-containing protein [Flammeovirga aprica]NME71203.1 DUF4493 domain-containing protein [Flammeovirga aprica JL-4]